MRMKTLVLRSVFWTVLVPGTVSGYLPSLILSRRGTLLPRHWGVAQIAGFLAIALGLSTLLKCIWDFASVGRGTLAPLDPPRTLVVRGLYRHVRNPMYVSVLIVLLGEALFFESWVFLQYALAWLLIVHLVVVLYEEPNLRRQFGAAYDEYCRAVRRWLPGRAHDSALQRSTSRN